MGKKKTVDSATLAYKAEAQIVEVEVLEISQRLCNVIYSQISNQLFVCYLSQELIGKSFNTGEIVSISIYGKPTNFKLLLPLETAVSDLDVSGTKSLPYLITKK
jgi:hypothetical protein